MWLSTARSLSRRGRYGSLTLVSRRAVSSRSVIYSEHGHPSRVTRIQETPIRIAHDQALIKFLASPINPSDINQIEGTYSILPSLPAIPGNEGVARVEAVPEHHNSNLKVGDWVLPANSGFGTWRTYAAVNPDQLLRIRSDIPLYSAATLAVNPVTAFRLLHDFIDLKPGSVIIQNAANSTVGLCVIQIAKFLNVTTINVIRDREDFNEVQDHLYCLGADYVVKEGDVEALQPLPRPILGFNAVGGTSCLNIAKSLAPGGQLITYGGMSKKPVSIPTGLLIFKDITLKGFWLTRTNQRTCKKEKVDILHKLMDMIALERLKVDIETIPFTKFSEAIERALKGKRKGKVVLTYEH